MHKLLFMFALAMTACADSSRIADPAQTACFQIEGTSFRSYMPTGFSVIERSPDGYFIRLASAERVSSDMLRTLAASFSGEFDRVDLCRADARERGDEYLSIIDGKVYDYENNRIYSLK